MKKSGILRALSLVLMVAMIATTFAACGSSETAETTASETTAAASEAEADSSEAEDASGEKTVKRALVSNMMKPLSWMDSDGVVSGYEYDIMVELNNRLENYTLEIEPVSEEVQDLAMETGDADISAGGYIPNENREKMYNIPDTPTAASSMMIYIRGEDADNAAPRRFLEGSCVFGADVFFPVWQDCPVQIHYDRFHHDALFDGSVQ